MSPTSAAVAALVNGNWADDTLEQSLVEGVTHTALDLMSFVLRGAMWLLGLSTFLAWLGHDMTTLVSFFGIGGLSIGLAAQAVLKDVVGTTILVLDEWFDVGSKIEVSGKQVLHILDRHHTNRTLTHWFGPGRGMLKILVCGRRKYV